MITRSMRVVHPRARALRLHLRAERRQLRPQLLHLARRARRRRRRAHRRAGRVGPRGHRRRRQVGGGGGGGGGGVLVEGGAPGRRRVERRALGCGPRRDRRVGRGAQQRRRVWRAASPRGEPPLVEPRTAAGGGQDARAPATKPPTPPQPPLHAPPLPPLRAWRRRSVRPAAPPSLLVRTAGGQMLGGSGIASAMSTKSGSASASVSMKLGPEPRRSGFAGSLFTAARAPTLAAPAAKARAAGRRLLEAASAAALARLVGAGPPQVERVLRLARARRRRVVRAGPHRAREQVVDRKVVDAVRLLGELLAAASCLRPGWLAARAVGHRVTCASTALGVYGGTGYSSPRCNSASDRRPRNCGRPSALCRGGWGVWSRAKAPSVSAKLEIEDAGRSARRDAGRTRVL